MTTSFQTVEDVSKWLDEKEKFDGKFLTDDVRTADLKHYSDEQLAARHHFYWREAIFEPDARIRAENQAEYDRTDLEIQRRRMYVREEAERVFE